MKIYLVLLAAAVSMTMPHAALCQESVDEPPVPDYWSIQFENDLFANSGDRHYTHGTEFSKLIPGTGPKWLSSLARWLPFYHLNEDTAGANYALGQKIFTPEDISQTALIPDDRPYAGFLFFGLALMSMYEENEDFETGNILEVTMGIVGPDTGADSVQKKFHEIIGSPTPMGWDNQLGNEITLGISYTRVWNIIQPLSESLQFGVTPHLTSELGNAYTFGAGGVMFRMGNNLAASFSPPNIRPGFPGVAYFRPSPDFSWYLFAGNESRIVFKDIFLDGNTFSDSHSVSSELLVGDYQFGLAMHMGSFRLALSNMLRTKEFEGQDDLTRYGALNLSFTF